MRLPYGEAHWPLLRMLVAHDLHTGLAMRPVWGAMHGCQAENKQGAQRQFKLMVYYVDSTRYVVRAAG